MLCRVVPKLAAVTAADLFALSRRSRFTSYTQFDDAEALQRSFQCAPAAERLAYEERAAAMNEELERAKMVEDTLLSFEDGEVRKRD